MRIEKPKATDQIKNSQVPIETNQDFSQKTVGKGYCTIDELDGKTYRITTVNGVVTSTEVI